MDCAWKIALYHNARQHRTKLKKIYRFGDLNWVNSINFNATTQIFWESWSYIFAYLYIWEPVFNIWEPISWESRFRCYAGLQLIKDTCSNSSLYNKWRETKLFEIVTGIATKPWLSRNMLPNIKTCENGWSNLSENQSVMAIARVNSIRIIKCLNLI